MTLADDEHPVTSSYVDSACTFMFPSSLFECAKAAVILLFVKIMTVTITETTAQMTRAVAKNPMDIVYGAMLVSKLCSKLWVLRLSVGYRWSIGTLCG